jgi:hypothetical protein
MVDGDARVPARGAAGPGLYAPGGAAVGMAGHGAAGCLAGNGRLAALGLGYLAGSHRSSPASAVSRGLAPGYGVQMRRCQARQCAIAGRKRAPDR